jgi:hypothetical protein
MYPIRTIRRLAAALAGLAGALLAFAAAAPAAFASLPPGHGGPAASTPLPRPPGWNKHPPLGPDRAGYAPISHVHTVVAGGMPGWQIILIAAGAVLLAATLAVLAGRMRAARRRVSPRAA